MKKKSFLKKHKSFITNVYLVVGFIVGMISFIERIALIYQSDFDTGITVGGRIISVAIQIVFFSFFVIFSTILGTLFYGTIILILLFVPYLLIKSIINKKL